MVQKTKKQLLKTNATFADFAGRLTAQWKLSTRRLRPVQPSGKREMLEILTQLIAIPTVAGNVEANRDALDYVEQFVKEHGLYVTRINNKGVESLVATTRKTKTPTVMLAAHVDVVPGSKELFELRQEGDRLYGRGTLDMKFAIAAYLQTLDKLERPLEEYDLGIMITTDEEAGGTDGTAYLVEEGFIPKVCILPDGGDNWQIQTASKGFLYLSVTANGKPAHGSRPWLGQNAIDHVVAAVQDIKQLFPELGTDTNTINIGKIQGGETANQVADKAEALIDMRFTSETEKKRILAATQKICQEHNVQLSVMMNGASTHFNLDNPFISPFAELITEVTGQKVVGSRTLGSNDTRCFAPHDVPCISVYPKGAGHHGPEEWISKTGLYQFQEILQKYLEKIARR